MVGELIYRSLSVTDAMVFVSSHYSSDQLASVSCFADLHEFLDANMTLPFTDDVGNPQWLEFANAIITLFDHDEDTNLLTEASP